ncbi:MAG: polysaccharide deacetylase family protein [Thermoplasmatota archaeon]
MTRMNVINGVILLAFSLIVTGTLPIISDGSDADHGADPSTDPVFVRDIDIYAEICTWYGDMEGALSLTFDDGLSSQADIASPAMNDFGLNGTFFVTVGNVGIPYGAEWFEWQEAADYGHEIGAHSITHPDLTTLSPDDLWDEVVFAKQMIEANLTGVDVETMSYPMGMYNSTVTSLVEQHYIGARSDRHNISTSPGPNPSTPENIYGVIPVNFGASESLKEMNDLVDKTISNKGWLVEMIHAVHDGGYDPVPYDNFTDHLDYVSSNDRLWVGTYGEVTKYIRERDSSTVIIEETSPYRYNITLTSPLDPTIFDHEMTVKIMTPIDWIDILIETGDATKVITPDILGGGGTIFLDMDIGEIITIEKVNTHPVISIPSDPEFEGRPFTPGRGSSETLFEFGMIYTSARNRPPLLDPVMSIDINGDGDLSDTFGEISEGDHSMSKADGGDMDYTDGCMYHLYLSLPPGSDPVIVFNALDSMRLEAVGNLILEIPGPHVNNPPDPPTNLRPDSLHDLTPTIRWDPAFDPDGDVVVYMVEIHGRSSWKDENITDTKYEIGEMLEMNYVYTFKVWSVDDDLMESMPATISFSLENQLPRSISGLEVDYDENLILTIKFDEYLDSDPDGDKVYHHINLIEDPDGENIWTILAVLTNTTEYTAEDPLKDHTDYRIWIRSSDDFDANGPVVTYDFRANIPPKPVRNLTVIDAVGSENALDISWDPSPEDDLRNYILIRDGDPGMSFNVDNTTSFRDSNVVDGTSYRYAVSAVDLDGAVDLINLTYVEGIPLDDVAPDRVTNLKASDLYNATSSISLSWDTSIDGRFHRYRIYRRNDSWSDPLIVHKTNPNDRNDNTWIDRDVVDNATYHYAVTAVDDSGNEDASGLVWVQGISIDDRWIPPEETAIDGTAECGNDGWIPLLAVLVLIIGIAALVAGAGIYLYGKSDREDDQEFD